MKQKTKKKPKLPSLPLSPPPPASTIWPESRLHPRAAAHEAHGLRRPQSSIGRHRPQHAKTKMAAIPPPPPPPCPDGVLPAPLRRAEPPAALKLELENLVSYPAFRHHEEALSGRAIKIYTCETTNINIIDILLHSSSRWLNGCFRCDGLDVLSRFR